MRVGYCKQGITKDKTISLPLPEPEGNNKVFATAPEEAGFYEFTLVARLGSLESRRTVKLNVAADPIKTTRISGNVNAISGFPLAGVRVAIGDAQAVTDLGETHTFLNN